MGGTLGGLITTGTPVALAAIVALVIVAAVLARWLASSLWRGLRTGLTSQGRRIGALEDALHELRADARVEGVRRFQLEATLLRRGFDLPPWPDSPDVVPDDRDDWAATAASPPIPPLPDFPRHRR